MNSYLNKYPLKSFFILLTLSVFLVFAVHLIVLNSLNLPLFGSKIILAYGFNYTVAYLTYYIIYKARKKHSESLGYFFLGGSSIKFLFFFILFNPYYKLDGELSKLEFASFFIPYSICLILGVIALSSLLNNKQK